MADSGSENIGGVNVSIGADYSPLEAAFSAAESKAEQAGKDIADALVSGASSAGDVAAELTDQLDAIGPAADGAAHGLDDLGESAGHAADGAHEAESGLAAMAEQMAAVGEALVITEGLRELGSEALSAADSITHASIALTTITGDGGKAEETIQGLEQLGMADGLAMPSLLSAATRMQAILGPSADVAGELKIVADGAAVMGTDIETAAQKFDMMATAGTANARTMTALGISLSSLATAYDAVIGGSDATAASVAVMFKALDQSQRIDVLNAALGTLGGTAEKVAEQTFGGQWQQLANAWEGIMVQVGQAILPVISDLLEFTKTDIVPFIQGLVSAFTGLPEPLKDTAVAVGLAAAAVIPLTGGLAALGLAFSGLEGLLPAVTGLLETFGVTAGEVAAEETIAATATEGIGVAAEAASVGAAGLAGIVGGVLVTGLVAAVASLTDLQARLKAAQSAYEGVSQTDFNQWLQSGIAGLKTAAISVEDLEAQQVKLKQALDLGVVSAQQYASAISAIEAAMKRVSAEDLASAVSQYSSGLTILKEATTKATDQQTLLNAVLADAQAKFQQAAAGYQAGTTTAQQYLAAQNAVTTAQTALQASMGPLPGSMDAITAAATKMATATGFVVSAQQEQANETAVARSSLDLATVSYNTSIAKLDLLKAQLDDTNAAYVAGQAPRSAVIAAEQNLQKAYADSQKESAALTTTVQDYASTMKTQVAAGEANALSGMEALQTALGPTMSAFLGVDAAVNRLAADVPNFGVQTLNISTGPLVGLQSALTEASAKVADLAAKMADGANVGQQYEKALTAQLNAQIALDQEIAVLNTGLQGATDAYSLARDAVAAAKAKVDDLTAAFQAGLATYAQVQSAQQALATAESNLAKETQQTTSATTGLTAANQALASSAPATVSAIESIGSAAASTASDVSTAADALDNLTSSLEKGIQVSTAASAIMYTMAGNVTTAEGLAAMLDAESALYNEWQAKTLTSAQQSANDAATKAQEQAMYDAGYTPASIAKKTATSLSQVLSDLGLTASQANETKSQASGSTSSTSSSSGGSNALLTYSTETVSGTTTAAASLSSTSSTSTGSTSATVSSSGAGTSAIDGGSYTAVTAHQAEGEVWAVNTSGTSSSGSSSSSGAITSAASSIDTAATSISSVSSSVGDLAVQVSEVAKAVADVVGYNSTSGGAIAGGSTSSASAGGSVSTTSSSSSGTSSGSSSSSNSGGGSAAAGSVYDSAINALALPAGATSQSISPFLTKVEGMLTNESVSQVVAYLQQVSATTTPAYQQYISEIEAIIEGAPPGYVATGNPQGSYIPTTGTTSSTTASSTGSTAATPAVASASTASSTTATVPTSTSTSGTNSTTVQVNVDARGAVGLSSSSLQSQITSAVTTQLVSQLYAAGARLTR